MSWRLCPLNLWIEQKTNVAARLTPEQFQMEEIRAMVRYEIANQGTSGLGARDYLGDRGGMDRSRD
jgi:hypothetical protein